MKSIKFPSPFTVLYLVIALAAAATWLMPAGNYGTLSYDDASKSFFVQTETGSTSIAANNEVLDSLGLPISFEKFEEGKIRRPVSIPGTYYTTESAPQGIWALVYAPIKGIYDSIDIILFVLIIGGFIGVFNQSGAFDEGIGFLANRFEGRESWLIILVMLLLSLGGTTFGMQEETMAFYPILVPVFLAAGYDLLVPVAVVFISTTIGIMGAAMNPFGTIIASDAAGVDWTLGLWSRLTMMISGLVIGIGYVLRYGNKIKKDPTRSLLYGKEVNNPFASTKPALGTEKLSSKTGVLLVLFALTFAVMIYGVAALGWWFEEMTALFLVAAMILGLFQRVKEKAFISAFINGARDMLGVSLIIGIARGVTIVLNDGQIAGTLLNYASNAVSGTSGLVFLPALMLVFAGLTLFISSSSGLALVSMPIMSGLGNVLGIPAEEIVNAYLFGFGLMTFITPTGLILPSLAMVNVNYNIWLKFIWPLMLILAVVGFVILGAGYLI